MEQNQTEWIRVTVTGVSGSQILTQITTHYQNGTEISSDGSSNIETGEGSGGPPFIGADLGKNGLINPSASEPWYINETVTVDANLVAVWVSAPNFGCIQSLKSSDTEIP